MAIAANRTRMERWQPRIFLSWFDLSTHGPILREFVSIQNVREDENQGTRLPNEYDGRPRSRVVDLRLLSDDQRKWIEASFPITEQQQQDMRDLDDHGLVHGGIEVDDDLRSVYRIVSKARFHIKAEIRGLRERFLTESALEFRHTSTRCCSHHCPCNLWRPSFKRWSMSHITTGREVCSAACSRLTLLGSKVLTGSRRPVPSNNGDSDDSRQSSPTPRRDNEAQNIRKRNGDQDRNARGCRNSRPTTPPGLPQRREPSRAPSVGDVPSITRPPPIPTPYTG